MKKLQPSQSHRDSQRTGRQWHGPRRLEWRARLLKYLLGATALVGTFGGFVHELRWVIDELDLLVAEITALIVNLSQLTRVIGGYL